MPQPTQHSLIRVLLLWTTVLSIIQTVFIILFFTAGHLGQSQNSSTVAPERQIEPQPFSRPTPSPPPTDDRLLLGKGKVLTYEATLDKNQIIWRTTDVSNGVISGEGKNLTILKDGYYFLSLQVTLKTPKCSFNGTRGSENSQSVSVMLTGDMTRDTTRKILLQGRISTHTCSTGLLSKAEKLTAGKKLTFNITLPPREIDDAAHRTHLDIIFFLKPQMI
ncbi:tumor necrosis factor ligand superfamily member 18 [Acanthopagrus schlegelii]